MKDFFLWILHTPLGAVSVISAVAALCFLKGSNKHRNAGKIYVFSMLLMAISGAVVSIYIKSIDEVFLAALICYAVLTAWSAAARPGESWKILNWFCAVYIFLFGALSLTTNSEWNWVNHPSNLEFNAVIALAFFSGDLLYIFKAQEYKTYRLLRHIWRILFSFLWSVAAVADKVAKVKGVDIKNDPVLIALPSLIIVSIMLYWLVRTFRERQGYRL